MSLLRHVSSWSNLFDWLFRKSDPAWSWSVDHSLTLELNLDNHSLCGIRPGDPVERLAVLGTPENLRPHRHEFFIHDRLGFVIESDGRSVFEMVVTFDTRQKATASRAFAGKIVYRAQPVKLAVGMTLDDWLAVFGEPYWRGEDSEELVLFYEFGLIEWQVEITTRRGLACITLCTPPLLDDQQQRKDYGVDKPWPPA